MLPMLRRMMLLRLKHIVALVALGLTAACAGQQPAQMQLAMSQPAPVVNYDHVYDSAKRGVMNQESFQWVDWTILKPR